MAKAFCFLGLTTFAAWAGLVPLEEGVAASGQIIVENDRQVVQHFEGGIIDQINVREGDKVEAGQIVLTLKETASLSSRDQLQTQIAALVAREARLQAVLKGLPEPDFSELHALELKDANVDALIAEEVNLFIANKSALDTEISILSQRVGASKRTANLRAAQIEDTQNALDVAQSDLQMNTALLEQQMVRRDRVSGLQREVAKLQADITRLTSERDEASALASDAERQIEQLYANLRQTASADLRDASAERLAASESLNAAQDILDRAVIVAPVSGEVLNLEFTTPGSVVTSAQTIMEIVPKEQQVVASIKIRPTDRATVFEGQSVRTQISAYRSWKTPKLEGVLQSISADLKTDPVTGADFYEARILLPASEIMAAGNVDITPGMPVDAFIFSGHSRTTFDYIFEPLIESAFKGMRAG
ncbi:MAG: HlyD family type I secretion periplasmic adaptor subunit [Pseudomonadota bacterium]